MTLFRRTRLVFNPEKQNIVPLKNIKGQKQITQLYNFVMNLYKMYPD